ncbi:hypothetical protein D5066_01850 [Enterobacter chuandaensis]|nr:hypothetical protein [Enterobacter chuandaensis]RJL04458.1 hypothetical protein D5066_01850 [Enterobacter chuandaensis]
MKFIKVAALAAIVVSGSAMAGMINQGGWGHGHGHGQGGYSGPNSTLNIYQNGGGNSALALQTDARNSVLNISQIGFGNHATAHQY